jgi:hypothetical protein
VTYVHQSKIIRNRGVGTLLKWLIHMIMRNLKNLSELKVKESVFSMEKNTVHGPDHFPVEFIKTAGRLLKETW